MMRSLRGIGIGFGLLVLVMIVLNSFTIVETGYRGVKTQFGKVVSESLPEGIYFYNPLSSKIVSLDVRTQKLESRELMYTRDVQQAAISYAVNINLQKNRAHLILQEVGYDWKSVLVPQIVVGTMKNIIGRWDAVDLIENRDKATREIETQIHDALGEKNVTVTRFELINIDFNDEFEHAVEEKVTAIQNAAKAKNVTVQIEEQAKQKVIAAKAEAESMRIRTEALTLNKALIDYEAVQKWDGKLPVYMMGNTMPLLNVGAINSKQQ